MITLAVLTSIRSTDQTPKFALTVVKGLSPTFLSTYVITTSLYGRLVTTYGDGFERIGDAINDLLITIH
jgi:hypothetical protein